MLTIEPTTTEADLRTRLATLTTQYDELVFAPGVHRPILAPLTLPDVRSIYGRGATLRCGAGGRFEWPSPRGGIMDGAWFDGTGKAPVVLKIGTGPQGEGSKITLRDVEFFGGAPGKQEIVQIVGLQNSDLGFRLRDNAAANGMLIDACKNLHLDCWPTNCLEHALRITTLSGNQRAASIVVNMKLSEACSVASVVVEDAEDVTILDGSRSNAALAVLLSRSQGRILANGETRLTGPSDVHVGRITGRHGGVRATFDGATYTGPDGVKVVAEFKAA